MKWKYFGYGIILSCVCAFGFRFFFNKPINIIQIEDEHQDSIENEAVLPDDAGIIPLITEFVPVLYAQISQEIRAQFAGHLIIIPKGVSLTSSQENIDKFKVFLEQIDIAPQEYLVDVLILSINKGETLRSGMSVFFDTLFESGDQIVAEYASTGRAVLTSSIGEIVSTLESSLSKVKIEGRSQLSVLDGETAIIKSGERRAVITDTQTEGLSIRSSYKYIDIGFSLSVDILPGACDEYEVLGISQSADNVTGYTYVSGDQIPIIAQRSIKTSVSVDMGDSVVLGGLTQNNIIYRSSGFPLLKSLPFFGRIFSNTVEEVSQSDLIIVLQPIISRSSRRASINKSFIEFQKIKKDF